MQEIVDDIRRNRRNAFNRKEFLPKRRERPSKVFRKLVKIPENVGRDVSELPDFAVIHSRSRQAEFQYRPVNVELSFGFCCVLFIHRI